jgi:hypothetical protein
LRVAYALAEFESTSAVPVCDQVVRVRHGGEGPGRGSADLVMFRFDRIQIERGEVEQGRFGENEQDCQVQ